MLDRIPGNPKADYVAKAFEAATVNFEKSVRKFTAPANPQPFPPVAPFADRFRHPGIGEATVSVDDGGLVTALVGAVEWPRVYGATQSCTLSFDDGQAYDFAREERI